MFLFIQGPPKSLVFGIVSDFYIGKTKRRLHDRKTEHKFKSLSNNDHSIADHVTATGHSNIKLVSLAAVFSIVRQRSWALRDDTKNGCEGD